MEKIDIKSLTCEELVEELKRMDLPAFRARQIYQWIHEKLAESFDDMTNLSKELRNRFKERFQWVS